MFKTLLLAVDVNAPAGAARSAEAAFSMARAEGATLHLLNVVPDTGMAIVGASMAADSMKNALVAAQSELEGWAKTNVPNDITYKVHVAEGTVYDQIIRTAQTLDIDAIIVGAHRPELKDYLIGPNAARVARHATQSVFVVR
ncbi:universal stress protein [Tateyamaria sp. ANG-S1]|uniref:universal stress protein n=1 Tax=Tateyamaria sp. ANG-S1 TaxID=1577905 RepID=UPI00057CC9BC|nr:universal stress protein [Tateyamaria sp. ANG-S1]KIC50393.1 universal stress protein UspA [Tateyamaria sp. ANG-S1]